jgi:hypothetical protein
MPKLSTAFVVYLPRAVATVLFVTLALAGCASTSPPSAPLNEPIGMEAPPPDKRVERLDKNVMQAAVADGISTGLALSVGAAELNPIMSTSPIGLFALTGAKIGLVKFADTLPEPEKRTLIKTSGALWGGAAVNNLMVLMSAPSPVAIMAGVAAGVLWWRHSSRVYERADQEMAARREGLTLEAEWREVAAVEVIQPAQSAP